MNYDQKCQLLIIGDSTVGKTSILSRFTDGKFSANYLATVGLDFFTKDMRFGNKIIRIKIWDTAGTERFRSFATGFYRNAQGILLVYDVNNCDSFDNLKYWLQSIKTHCTEANIIIVIGNKIDLPREIKKEEAEKYANDNNFKYFETSAKTGEGIEESITYLVEQVLKNNKNNNTNSDAISLTDSKIKTTKESTGNTKQKQKKDCC